LRCCDNIARDESISSVADARPIEDWSSSMIN
jgi:hypothetical protein